MKITYSLLIALFFIQCQGEKSKDPVSLIEKAQSIHLSVTTIDTHDDISVKYFTDSPNYTQNTETQVNIPKMQAGGLDVAWFIVYTAQGELSQAGYTKASKNAQAKFDAIHRLVDKYGKDKIALATSSKEVDSLIRIGKKVAMIGVENAFPIGGNIDEVERYFNMGARYMSLAHNGHNQFSDSNTGEFDNTAKHNGISDLGKKIIEKMNYYGIMVDVSHPSKEAIRQTIAYSKAPVIASHSSARFLCDHPRNLDDQQLQWVKESGGVVQTVALAAFINKDKAAAFKKAKDSILESNPNSDLKTIKINHPPVNVSDFVDHIDYIKNKIGINHVGISSDFDGGGGIEGWKDASQTFNVTLELVKRGYSKQEIAKVWGGNLLRVLDSVQSVAQQLQRKN